ncbi:hypothetical protein Btru_032487 [Bulinus truncatus]|nr:hypothetical protein Btru_032487 [Bulinus truncatus]
MHLIPILTKAVTNNDPGFLTITDFCIKRYGVCKRFPQPKINAVVGWTGGLPPHGYLSGGNPPKTCNKIINIAKQIPNRNLINGTIRVYGQTGDWGRSLPRVFFNPALVPYLEVEQPLHQCLENNAPFPNGMWNYANPFQPNPRFLRTDSFHYNEDGNNTWSYQCYCDFCYSCQGCTNG